MRNRTKRELMLEAAHKLFLKNGFSKTKIIDIADEAGIGKGTVYEYFPSKELLFAEVFNSRIMNAYDKAGLILNSACSAEQKFLDYARFEADNLSKFGDSLHLLPDMVMTAGGICNDAFHKTLFELWSLRFKSVLSIMQQGIRDGEFVDADAEMMTLSVLGSFNFYLLLKYNMMPLACPGVVDASGWKLEEYAQLILKGIKI